MRSPPRAVSHGRLAGSDGAPTGCRLFHAGPGLKIGWSVGMPAVLGKSVGPVTGGGVGKAGLPSRSPPPHGPGSLATPVDPGRYSLPGTTVEGIATVCRAPESLVDGFQRGTSGAFGAGNSGRPAVSLEAVSDGVFVLPPRIRDVRFVPTKAITTRIATKPTSNLADSQGRNGRPRSARSRPGESISTSPRVTRGIRAITCGPL